MGWGKPVRSRRGFDLTIVVIALMCVGLVGINLTGDLPWVYPAAGLAGIAAVGVLYVFGYRPVLPEGGARPWWLAGLLALACGIACWGIGLLMPLAVAAYVMVWATNRRAWTAILSTVVTTVAATVGAIVGFIGAEDAVGAGFYVLVGGISAVCALGYGFWIRAWRSNAEEHRRLAAALRATQDRLAATARHAGALEERARVSRDLHDTLAQSVSAMVLVSGQARAQERDGGDLAGTLELLERMARSALADARSVVTDLAGVDVAGDASTSVAGIVERFRRESALTVETELAPADVAPEIELALVRCAQEGLANVRKHAGATRATVRLERTDDDVRLTVADDGAGPPAAATALEGRGFGLRGMRERVGLLDGTVSLTAAPDGGGVLRVTVPLERSRA